MADNAKKQTGVTPEYRTKKTTIAEFFAGATSLQHQIDNLKNEEAEFNPGTFNGFFESKDMIRLARERKQVILSQVIATMQDVIVAEYYGLTGKYIYVNAVSHDRGLTWELDCVKYSKADQDEWVRQITSVKEE